MIKEDEKLLAITTASSVVIGETLSYYEFIQKAQYLPHLSDWLITLLVAGPVFSIFCFPFLMGIIVLIADFFRS